MVKVITVSSVAQTKQDQNGVIQAAHPPALVRNKKKKARHIGLKGPRLVLCDFD